MYCYIRDGKYLLCITDIWDGECRVSWSRLYIYRYVSGIYPCKYNYIVHIGAYYRGYGFDMGEK